MSANYPDSVRKTAASGEAVFSPCATWRYALYRSLSQAAGPTVTFVCLNPSVADEIHDDPTVRRCTQFARQWGFPQLILANLFALRSTLPKALYDHHDPVGPENDLWIARAVDAADLVVAAWGNHGSLRGRGREVARRLSARADLLVFGTTRPGEPRHPLYLRADACLTRWTPEPPT